MTDIMELIKEYGRESYFIGKNIIENYSFEKDKEREATLSIIKSHIQAMQEVCDIAIKCKGLGMNPDLYDAVTKLEGLK